MKSFLLVITLFFSTITLAETVYVDGYTDSNGRYVPGHYERDGNSSASGSVRGNTVDPYSRDNGSVRGGTVDPYGRRNDDCVMGGTVDPYCQR